MSQIDGAGAELAQQCFVRSLLGPIGGRATTPAAMVGYFSITQPNPLILRSTKSYHSHFLITVRDGMHDKESEHLNSEMIDRLLAGTTTLEPLSELDIDDISDNVRLKNVYYRSGALNLSEFLSLGQHRKSLRNCGRKTEHELRESLKRLLSGKPIAKVKQRSQRIDHSYLLSELGKSLKPRKSEWNEIRKDLRRSNFADYLIASVAAELDLDWPISPKSAASSMKIGDLLEMTLAQIREMKGFGRKKLIVYLKCAIHLHQRLQDGDTFEEDLGIRERVHLILKHGRLTEREEEVIRFRFGIQEERKHTLTEIKDFYDVTRERVRQIESQALRKLRMSRYYIELPRLLTEGKLTLWEQLCDSGKLRKQEWMEPLEDKLGFEYQIALEICDDNGNRNPTTSVLANWLDTHFYHDETYWYKVEPSPLGDLQNRDKVSSELLEFLDQL